MAPQAPATMAKQSTPKTMSSRLMTMKFMQRGAAQAAAEASSPSTPKTDEESSASKRRKVTHKSSPATPSTPIYDQKAIQAAIEEEEKKRLAAIEKRAAELGDSHWVLDDATVASAANGSKAPLNIVQVGFAQIDYDGVLDGAQGSVDLSNKTRFRFNMKRSKERENGDSKDAEDSDDSDSSGGESEEGEVSRESGEESDRGQPSGEVATPQNKSARHSRSSKKSEERKKAKELAEKRRKKEVNLNKLTSISGGGSQSFQKPPSFTCHGCGKPGHKVADCPKRR